MPRKRSRALQEEREEVVAEKRSDLEEDDFASDTQSVSGRSGSQEPQHRNAANARERARMRVLSKAFCRLKTRLPWVPADTKLSKLDTLRLAGSYIAHLRAVLRDEPRPAACTHPLNLAWPFAFQHGGSATAGQSSPSPRPGWIAAESNTLFPLNNNTNAKDNQCNLRETTNFVKEIRSRENVDGENYSCHQTVTFISSDYETNEMAGNNEHVNNNNCNLQYSTSSSYAHRSHYYDDMRNNYESYE